MEGGVKIIQTGGGGGEVLKKKSEKSRRKQFNKPSSLIS